MLVERSCVFLLLLWLVGTLARDPVGYRRKVSLEYNPGLNISSVNLLHIRAVGNNDTIHYVWSTIGAPTALLVYTRSQNSTLHVNWTKLFSPAPSGAVHVEPTDSVLYSTAVIFSKVFEYNGANTSDLFKVPADQFYPTYNLANFTWESLGDKMNKTTLTATFRGAASGPEGTFGNGSISFQNSGEKLMQYGAGTSEKAPCGKDSSQNMVTAYEENSRDARLPRLLHTANCSKVNFVMSGVAPRGNHSRFALEIVTVEEREGRKQLESIRSIDDEYTPTIFEMAQLVSVPRNHSTTSSFLQWKTTAYSSQHAERADTIHCQYYPLQTTNCTVPRSSIAHAYFGEDLESHHAIAAINISFGSEDGEAYEEKRYLSWSALIGFGEPPKDTFSTLVIAILAVGLGTPVVLLVGGSIAAFVSRKKRFPSVAAC
ncbi:glycosylated lysosomal membrane protein isoform X2 [Eublepharis macularius]|uniref:Glycosylated lysosomal membrane protein isoform X2 n=1 Tax=Eublepharis macularius TaxID=481883 RepID=A0AA97LA26_EUBMA|nr:glycosylated lysosomal membrane protein isoform X2 [Eublepharis macularius]